ncbi:MAG: hypothetical protein SFU84_07295 [Gemmatimonadales bacterium]|nr:hypothetical protein [Gemmatimonadales bacterium]
MRQDDSVQEDPIFSALREVKTLSRIPLPMFTAPPWEKIRAALPPGATLPDRPVHVLVDLDIDASGTVVHAAVGQVPPSVSSHRMVAASVGADGRMTIQPPSDTASIELARAVAVAHLGAKFSPGERDGQAVPVRMFRMGIEVSPAELRDRAAP